MRRRGFLQVGLLAASGLQSQAPLPGKQIGGPRKRLAAIATAYPIGSNADDLITRFLQGYWINDDFHPPACDIASLYTLQVPANDVGRRLAAAYRIPVASSISDALTLRTGSLEVDGILLVGDEYEPSTSDATLRRDRRFNFFEQAVKVFKQSGRSVPVFCHGYLSTDWDEAWQVYQWSRDIGFPLMAGSSPPVTFRRPDLDYHLPDNYDDARLGDRNPPRYPQGVEFDGALVIAPGSESSGAMFGSLEILQSFLERRKGGETGIRTVERFAGADVWRTTREGRWSRELMLAALRRAEKSGSGRPEDAEHPAAWLITYNDGNQGCVLSLGGLVSEYLAAFRIKGRHEIDSTLCYTPVASRNDFSLLVHGISGLMQSGMCPYPIERTLLTNGAFACLRTLTQRGGQRIETPMLKITYTAPERSFYAHGRGW